jgi:hypothetical protein
MITDRDKQEWAHHHVTQEFLAMLQETRQSTMEAWARGNYTSGKSEETVQKNAEAIGAVGMLDQCVEVINSYKELVDPTIERVL